MKRHPISITALLIVASVLAIPLNAQDDTPPAVQVDILTLDDRSYPHVAAYLTVIDTNTQEPINNLGAEDFLVTINGQDTLSIDDVEAGAASNRPVHLLVVLDLTSSITATEFEHMRDAAGLLIASLDVQDQVGIVTMDHRQVDLLQPLSPDHNAAINAMHLSGLSPVVNRSGNVVGDGIYRAVEALVTPAPQVRPTVVVFTDVPADSIGGDQDLDAVRALALERDTVIHVVYFETEDAEGEVVEGQTAVELAMLARDTGGVMVTHPGETRDDSEPKNYDDDAYLPEMAQVIANILETEYRVSVTLPLPANDTTHSLSVVAAARGVLSPVAQTAFIARSGFIELRFAELENGQHLTLPHTLRVDVVAPGLELDTLKLERVDSRSGRVLPLADLDPASPSYTLTPDMIDDSLLTLRISARDELGNEGERYLTLIVENPGGISTDSPAPNGEGETTSSDESEADNETVLWVALAIVGIGVLGSVISLAIFGVYRRRWGEDEAFEQAPVPSTPPAASPALSARVVPKPVWNDPLEADTQPQAEDEGNTARVGLVPRALLVGGEDEEYPLYEGENTIGRHSSNMVQILDASVSRYHAVIEIHEGNAQYMDWQATHPSRINDQAVPEGQRITLTNDDQIQLGVSTLRFIWRD